jgi:2,4-dienoyl-CoA reductase-like NADH-dependent reductase (Old Yellow Enzyme family)
MANQIYNHLYPHLFSPFTVKNVTFKNRIFNGPNGTYNTFSKEGFLADHAINHYGCRARGGAAVVTLNEAKIDGQNGCAHDLQINLLEEVCLRQLVLFTDYVHAFGAKASIELTHCGQWSLPPYNGGRNPIGPSAKVLPTGVTVDEMTEDDMEYVADCFANGAQMAKRAGFDMSLIHGGHGWLLAQFLSPLENRRTDKFGGSLENRARFPLMVLDRIRAKVGYDFLLEYRLSVSELTPGGLEIDEAVEFIKMIEDKIDFVHCSVGMRRNALTRAIMHPTHFMPHGCNVYLAEAMKKGA